MSKPVTISSLLKRKEGEKEGKEKGYPAKHPNISTSNRFLALAEKGKAEDGH